MAQPFISLPPSRHLISGRMHGTTAPFCLHLGYRVCGGSFESGGFHAFFVWNILYPLGIKDDAAHPRLDQQNKNYNKHGDILSISLPATLCLSIIASSVSSWSLILHRQFHTLTSSRNIHPSYITINYCFISYHQHHYFHYHHDCSLLSLFFHCISVQYDLWKLNAPIRLQDLLSSFGSSRTPVQYARLIYPKGAWQWPLMANPVENMDKYGNVMG